METISGQNYELVGIISGEVLAERAAHERRAPGFPQVAGTAKSESRGASRHLLEGKAEDGNLLAGHCVEHAGDDHLHEAVLLVVVDLDHRVPVVRHPLQAHALTATQQTTLQLSLISV